MYQGTVEIENPDVYVCLLGSLGLAVGGEEKKWHQENDGQDNDDDFYW